MGAYYYLAAQLPHLVLGQKAPMSSAAFRELAGKHLSSGEAAGLAHCNLDTVSSNAASSGDAPAKQTDAAKTPWTFINSWKEWEGALRLNLAKSRALKLKRESALPVNIPLSPADAVNTAKAASALDSPLEAELFLDKAKWAAIESLQGFDTFNENAIYAYLLKLLLMERNTAFNADEGFNAYKGLYSAILSNTPGDFT